MVMRPALRLALLGLLTLPVTARADGTCADLLDFAQVCVTDEMSIARSTAFPEVLFAGPVPTTDLWRAEFYPLHPVMTDENVLRDAVGYQIGKSSMSASLTAEILVDEATEVNGREAYLIVEGITTPNQSIPRPFVYLGLRFDNRVVVVTTSDPNPRADFAPIVESARIMAAFVRPLDTP